MGIVLRCIGWTVLALALFVVAANVVNRAGRTTGIVVALSLVAAAWAGHTDRSRALVNLFRDAMLEAGVSDKQMAIEMDISKSQLSEAFSGEEQLSFSRAANAEPAVWLAFARLLLEQSGEYVVLKAGVVSDLVYAVQLQTAALRERQLAEYPSDREVA